MYSSFLFVLPSLFLWHREKSDPFAVENLDSNNVLEMEIAAVESKAAAGDLSAVMRKGALDTKLLVIFFFSMFPHPITISLDKRNRSVRRALRGLREIRDAELWMTGNNTPFPPHPCSPVIRNIPMVLPGIRKLRS